MFAHRIHNNNFDRLMQAIMRGEHGTVTFYLKSMPELITLHNLRKENILHAAAMLGDEKTFQIFSTYIDKATLKKLAQEKTIHDDTALHIAARYHKRTAIKFFIDTLEEQAPNIAKHVNLKGEIPLQLLRQYSNADETYLTMLEKITIPYFVEDPTKLIQWKTLLKQFPEAKQNSELAANLSLACESANYARSTIQASYSHPASNHWDANTFNLLKSIISTKMYNELYDKKKTISNYEIDPVSRMPKPMCVEMAYIKYYRRGNCPHYAAAAAYRARRLSANKPVETFSLENGDHEFTVIGRKPDSNPRDYTTWGRKAVVCDAWSGEIFPAYLIPQKLGYHKFYYKKDRLLNIVGPFNPRYHFVKLLYQVPSTLPPRPVSKNYPDRPVAPVTPKKSAKKMADNKHNFFHQPPINRRTHYDEAKNWEKTLRKY